jgi:hypothetical protein
MPKLAGVRLARPIVLAAVLIAAALIVARPAPFTIQASVAEQPARQAQVVGEGPNRAGIAIKFGDGRVETRCVAFAEQSLGGDELLQRSGLVPALSPEGAVCSISGEGCPTDDCFCHCSNFQDCQYWAYYQWQGDSWVYSQFGATADSVSVSNGGLQAWSWGAGDSMTGAPPPDVTYDDLCRGPIEDATPTPSPTAADTPEGNGGAPTAPPQVAFSAGSQALTAGQCTTLSWSTVGAATVTLDGGPVAFRGSQQVCPSATRTWSVVATNAAGQTVRQVSIAVSSASALGTPPAQFSPTPRPGLPGPALRSGVTQAPPTGSQPTVPRAGVAPASLAAGAVEAEVPLAQTTGALSPVATPTPYVFSLPTETPRPRRVLGADGGPTPTPLLIARAASGSAAAPGSKAGSSSLAGSGSSTSQLIESRRFSPDLLPGYAAYIVTVGVLLAMGWYTLRRRNGHPADEITQPADDDGRTAARVHEE